MGFKRPETVRPENLSVVASSSSVTTLPGKVLSTAYGEVWVEKQCYPIDYEHGCYKVGAVSELSKTSLAFLGTPDLGPRPVFLDTETTGLSRGAGTLVFLTGVGAWDDDGLTMYQVFLHRPELEDAALHYLDDVLAQATGLVTFNGLGFDVPLLENRFILNRMSPRWTSLPHLDLLKVARLLWRDHLTSRRLGVLETEILGIARTGEDLPSDLIPDIYRQYVQEGTVGEMPRVFYHNLVDVLSLATLLVHVGRMVESPEQMPLAATEWTGVGWMYDYTGYESQAFVAWQRALADGKQALPAETCERLYREMGARYRRRKIWDEALAIWDAWAQRVPQSTEPLIERAKYYEWVARDIETALAVTDLALKRLSPGERLFYGDEIEHRRTRLLRKLGG